VFFHVCTIFKSQSSSTPLVDAAQYGHAECVRLLLESGAEKEAKDNVCDRMMQRS
jgi:hypothetical protein